MKWRLSAYRRIRGLFRAEEIEREIDEELQFHLDMRTAENISRGLPADAARRAAERRFGNLTRTKERGYNEALDKEYFGGANAVGLLLAEGVKNIPDMEIIGIAGDARYDHVRGSIPRQVFVAMDVHMYMIGGVDVYARIQGDPRAVMPRLREQVRRVDSTLIIDEMRTLDDQLNRLLSNERLLSILSAGFASLACLLAVVGLHGVLSFVVARRTREIGIRIALGADKGRVIGLIIRS